MLNTLIESDARTHARTTNAPWAAASAVVHALLITGAIAATVTRPAVHDTTDWVRPVYLSPSPTPQMTNTRAPATPQRPVISEPGIEFHEVVIPAPSFSMDSMLTTIAHEPIGPGIPGPATTSAPSTGVFDPGSVDRQVVAFSDNPRPTYPRTLQSLGIEGDVVAQFVVDVDGRVEPTSITFPRATHSAFADAVRSALLRSRFVPAEVAGHPVRQLVEQRFTFSLRS